MFKDLVGNVRSGNASRQTTRHAGSSPLEVSIEPQRRLALAVRETARQIGDSYEALKICHRTLMQAAQEYLAFDMAAVDPSAMMLVTACASSFEACESALNACRLPQVRKACDSVAAECEQVALLVRSRQEAAAELQHYEEKLAGIPATERDKLARNREKRDRAREVAQDRQSACEGALLAFSERRVVHTRATLHALLGASTELSSDWGRACDEAATLSAGEMRPGVRVQVAGLLRSPEFNGQAATIKSVEEGGYAVDINGVQQVLRAENLLPLDLASTPGAEEQVPACGSDSKPGRPRQDADRLSVRPSLGPCDGCEVELATGSLSGPASEVLIGGQRAEILGPIEGGVRVRLPPGKAGDPLPVEVRAAGWQRYVAAAQDAFCYYEPIVFGTCSSNTNLSSEDGAPAERLTVASRASGLVNGVALTAGELPQLTGARATASTKSYYFEIDVLQVAEKRTNRTLALGFAWPSRAVWQPAADPASPSSKRKEAASLWEPSGRLPENASALSRALVVGGDLPKVHLGGTEMGKISGWRPVVDVIANTAVGALLEASSETLRLTVFQDGTQRCTTEVALPPGWAGAPHGVVDVCGSVQSVRLRQGSAPPDPAPEQADNGGKPSD